jgi:hypothetical protein
MARIAVFLVVSVFLTACEASVKGPSASISTPKVAIYDGTGGHFCPPGQAKKGRC